ncbi:MAG: QueT transporter family protein [Acidilobaceae archaeon]
MNKRFPVSAQEIIIGTLAIVYFVLTVALHPISYGPIQVRMSDILSPLSYILGLPGVAGLTLGTFLANFFSPYGFWDVVIGTACTFTYCIINYGLFKLFGYRRVLLPVVALIDSIVVGIYIGIVLLGTIAKAGDPLKLAVLLTGETLIPMSIGALVLVPLVARALGITER